MQETRTREVGACGLLTHLLCDVSTVAYRLKAGNIEELSFPVQVEVFWRILWKVPDVSHAIHLDHGV